jgi:hypothetical protein
VGWVFYGGERVNLLLCCAEAAGSSPAEERTGQRCQGDDEADDGTVDC